MMIRTRKCALTGSDTGAYSRSPKNPALQQLQKSSKSASTTPLRPIGNYFAAVGVRNFSENGCTNQVLGTRCRAYRRDTMPQKKKKTQRSGNVFINRTYSATSSV